MPLDAFIDEVPWLFHRRPTPPEILAERIKVLRHAEAEGRFDQALAALRQAEEWRPSQVGSSRS